MTEGSSPAEVVARYDDPNWTAKRERAVRERIDRALSRRRTARSVLLLAATALLLVLGIGPVRRALEPSELVAEAQAPRPDRAPVLLALDDGSSVSRASIDARVTPLEVTPTTTKLRLQRGEARFEVAPQRERQFQVLAPGVTITVLGTAFRVALTTAGVRVTVEHGRVEIRCWDQRTELWTGGQQLCPATPPPASAPANPASAAPIPQPSADPGPPRQRAATSWRTLAHEGDYQGAYSRLSAEGVNAVRDEPADLLFAADVARLSGHPGDAVTRLERVLQTHSADSRAPLAAFTLGRILLDELGRPREAAESFALARRLAPTGAMAQDSLAREVESWSRAGESRSAREKAKQYLDRYPEGRRVKAVRYHGGLD